MGVSKYLDKSFELVINFIDYLMIAKK